jgi:mannosyltransferase
MIEGMLHARERDSRASASPPGRLLAADWLFLAVLVALGAALRFYALGSPLWFDEILTLLESVRLPLSRIVTHFPGNNDHPLYSVLAHLSVQAFGETAWALRLPAALFGVAAIPLLYVLGVAVTQRREAAAACVMLTVSYHHIWFSQNARAYTALLVWALVSTIALLRWLDTGKRSYLVVYAVSTAAGAYGHLTMVLVSVGQALAMAADWLAYRRSSRLHNEWRTLAAGFAGAAVLTVLMYAPMLLDLGTFFTTQTARQNEVATPRWAILAAVKGLELGFGLKWGIALGAIVALAGTVSYLRERPTVALLFLLPAPVTVGLALAVGRPIFPRFAFFALGFALLIIVRGAGRVGELITGFSNGSVSRQTGGSLAIVLLTSAAIVLSLRSLPYAYRYPKQNYPEAVSMVERMAGSRDRVVLVGDPAAVPIQGYFGKPWVRVNTTAELRAAQRQADRVWVVYTFPAYIQAAQPQLWMMLRDECRELAEIHGTVAGGSITIRRCP